MKVAMLPRSPLWRANPYLDRLEAGLRKLGVETANDPNDALGLRWLLRSRGTVDVIHFHWLEHHYARESAIAGASALARFAAKLVLAKALGYRLVWTVHNLQPHEPAHPWLDQLCWQLLARFTDRVIVHCEEVGRQLAARFGRTSSVRVIPLMNYVGVYREMPDKETARHELGLDGSGLVFLCFGTVRPYKGFQDAISAFRKQRDDHARLLIAGPPLDERISREVSMLAEGDPRILTALRFIPDDDVPCYLSASDVVVLPFRRIDTSSSAILAMSMARPVLAPALGCLPELVSKGTGIVYDPCGADALTRAMSKCFKLDLQEMGRLAYRRVSPFTAELVARQHLEVYSG